MRKLTEKEIEDIIRLYTEEKMSINKLKPMFKLQHEDIKQVLIDNGIQPRSHRDSRKSYDYDETYFSNINTPDKAYWLGFIYADGFITKREQGSPVFGITLAEQEPLDKINKAMKSNKKIGVYKKTNSYSDKSIEYKLAFTSQQLVSDLEKWGCVENKTFKLKFPEFLSEDLVPHFVRGYFDGDGSIYLHTQKANNKEYTMLGAQFSGIHDFLNEMIKHFNFLNEDEKCLYQDTRKQTDCWRIQLNSNLRALKLYHYMYKDCPMDICLSRKRNKFEDFIKERGSTTTIVNPIYNNAEYKDLCYLED